MRDTEVDQKYAHVSCGGTLTTYSKGGLRGAVWSRIDYGERMSIVWIIGIVSNLIYTKFYASRGGRGPPHKAAVHLAKYDIRLDYGKSIYVPEALR